MKATGIVRRIDELGRIVIPKEIRRTLRIRETDPLEIYTDTEDRIILKKYSPMANLSEFALDYAEALSNATGLSAIITDREHVIAAAGADKKLLMNKAVTKELGRAMNERKHFIAFGDDEAFIKATEEFEFKQEAMHPIISAGDVLGCVFMMSKDMKYKFSDNEKKMVKTAADFLGKHMEC